ncbi:MAG: hypothetical protein QOI47_596 [Actinomycetota bacterium]|jgi:hypothetical protein|nr:hypothetical protein [Actinomycetota bacterium]
MRKLLVLVALMGLVAAVPALAASPSISLGLNGSKFWDGGFVVGGPTDTTTFSYPLSLAAGGARLRVAIDTPSREDTFQVDLLDPKGAVQGTASNSNQFNAEAFAAKPVGGAWTVKVTPNGATRARFRLRAKLEAAVPTPPPGKVALLPDLKTVPPFELTFIAPANPANGLYPPDTVNPPLDVAGQHPASCTVDEDAPASVGGGAAQRCLRLTSGPINVGAGPFDMRFTMVNDAVNQKLDATHLRGPIHQVIHYGDGSTTVRDAGTYIFHTTHAHFHDENILTYELFKVPSPGTLVAAGAGVKSGFCPADQLFGEWGSFSQDPQGYFGTGDTPTGNCFSPTDGFIGLTRGWGDVYRWQRPGQYVEFGDNTDGLYVVRATVDKGNHILESNETNNSSYALISITGETIRPIERGQGLSPWDPKKVVFSGAGPASRD